MNSIILFISLILIWIMVVTGLYQRIFVMPGWFADPPASFELIRKQSRKSQRFWIPLSILFIISLIGALIFNWQFNPTRNALIAALVCFAAGAILSGSYFIKEVIAFTKIPPDTPQSPDLLRRTKFWLKWTSVRDVLQLLTAVFITIAFISL